MTYSLLLLCMFFFFVLAAVALISYLNFQKDLQNRFGTRHKQYERL